MSSSRIARRRRPEDGAAAVEFALVVVPLLLIVFGVIQYGFYFFAEQSGTSAANSALRQLSVGNCQDSTQLATYVNARISGAADGTATITTNYYNANGTAVTGATPAKTVPVGGTVKLTIVFSTLDFKLPFLPFLTNPQVSRVVQARVEDVTDEGCGA